MPSTIRPSVQLLEPELPINSRDLLRQDILTWFQVAATEDIPEPTDTLLWTPHPTNQPQCEAYDSPADILGYGGAGGGGKTDLILGLAVTRHSVSKIFRREAKQLRDMWERSREIIGYNGKSNENLGTWRNLPGGRRIDLLGVKDDEDVEKHRGRPADLFAFDEATEFTETQIRFLLGWNRSVIEGQRCRAVLCFNPPSTTEGQWVLKFF